MSKKFVVPAGYQVIVSSTECDGDIPSTSHISGLSRDDAQFTATLLDMLKIKGTNTFFDCDVIFDMANKATLGLDISDKLKDTLLDAHDIIEYLELYSLDISMTVYEDSIFIRQICHFAVCYIETPIENITDQFIPQK